jgi:hypothetical protein
MYFYKDLLADILLILLGIDDPIHYMEHQPLILFHQYLKGLKIPMQDAWKQFLFIDHVRVDKGLAINVAKILRDLQHF